MSKDVVLGLMHLAARDGDVARMRELIHQGESPHARQQLHQQTPLHFAVEADSTECVKVLLDAGSEVNAADARGETPVFYVRSAGVLRLLVDAGADLNVISERGQYPFEYCAAYIRSLEVMEFWIDHGVALNHVPAFGWPAVNAVCGMVDNGQQSDDDERGLALLDLLINAGADVSLHDQMGETALYCACINRHPRLAERLLDAGADPNQQNRSGDTPLHAAVFRKSESLVRMLLARGADVNIANRHRTTPIDVETSDAIQSLLKPHHRPQTTPVTTADQCMARLKAIKWFKDVPEVGCSEAEIAAIESKFRLRLPESYREFLRRIGKGIGEFMVSDRWLFKYQNLDDIGRDEDYGELCELPADYFVFAERSGCYWAFFVADGTCEDPPVFAFDDGEERDYKQVARSVWEFIESLVIDYELWSEDSLE